MAGNNAPPKSDSRFYWTGGTMRSDSPSYIERSADRELYEALSRGEYCYVLTSRQMGKSSLMVRTSARLREAGAKVVVLDLTAAGANLTPEQWYDSLLALVGASLGLEEELDGFWLGRERLGPLRRWMQALREVVLAKCGGRVVVFIDEIDAVRNLPFSTDEFFAAIRECFNRRAEDPEFERLTFCLIGVATPSDLIQDSRTTPFNIGRRIELNDFSGGEAVLLARGLEREAATAQALLKRILYWTGGHPYLTQRLCQAVAEAVASRHTPTSWVPADASQDRPDSLTTGDWRLATALVDRVCEALFLSRTARNQDNNLIFVRERLLRGEEDLAGLLEMYSRIRRGKAVCGDDTTRLAGILKLSGIVRPAGSKLRVSNRIYERVFDPAWVAQQMPGAELRRQRAAYRRGLLRAASVAALIVAMMTGLALSAMSNAQRAQGASLAAERTAQSQRELAARLQVALQRLEQALELARAERNRANRQTRLARAAEGSEHTQRQKADGARREAEQQRQVAVAQRRIAETQREQSRQRLVALNVANGWRLVDEGNLLESLPWFAEALKLDHMSPAREEAHRVQLATVLRRCPTLIHAWFHPAPLFHAEFSRDGRRVVTACVDGTVRVWDALTGRPLAAPIQTGQELVGVSFSPNGRRIVTVSGKTAQIWNVETGQPAAPPLKHADRVWRAAFSPDGRRIATGSGRITEGRSPTGQSDGTVLIWDAQTGQPLTPPVKHRAVVNAVAFSPDGRRIVSASGDGTARVWDAAAGQPVTPALAHRAGVRTAVFSPDGRRVVTASDDGTARVWDAATGQPVVPPLMHTESVRDVQFSPEGHRLVTACDDGTVRVWDAVSGQPVTPPLRFGPGVGLTHASFSPDGGRVLGSNGDTVQVWDAATGEPVGPPLMHNAPVWDAAFSPDGQRVITACRDRVARVWSLITNARVVSTARDGFLGSVFSPDGRRVVAAGWDGTERAWDAVTGQPLFILGRTRPALSGALQFSPDGRRIVGADTDHTARIWDAATGRPTTPPLPHHDQVMDVAFSSDSRRVVTGCMDGTARVWDAATGRPLTPPLRHSDPVFQVLFSPDGRHIVAAGGIPFAGGGEARVWDATTGRPITPPLWHPQMVRRVAFSPDGRWLLTGDGSALRIWDARTGRPALRAPKPGAPASWAEFSPDGRRLVSTGRDQGARVWESATGRPITPSLRLHPHHYWNDQWAAGFIAAGRWVIIDGAVAPRSMDARVWDAATGELLTPRLWGNGSIWNPSTSPDGRRVLTANADGSAWIWDLSPDNRPLQDLTRLAEVLSGSRVDETGGLVPLDTADFQAAWNALHARHLGGLSSPPKRAPARRPQQAMRSATTTR